VYAVDIDPIMFQPDINEIQKLNDLSPV